MLQSFHASLTLCINLKGFCLLYQWGLEFRLDNLDIIVKEHRKFFIQLAKFWQKCFIVNPGKLWMWIWSGVMVGWPGAGCTGWLFACKCIRGQRQVCASVPGWHKALHSQYSVRNTYLVRDNFLVVVVITCFSLICVDYFWHWKNESIRGHAYFDLFAHFNSSEHGLISSQKVINVKQHTFCKRFSLKQKQLFTQTR